MPTHFLTLCLYLSHKAAPRRVTLLAQHAAHVLLTAVVFADVGQVFFFPSLFSILINFV